MKPFRILLFLLGVFLILFTVSLLFPERGIDVGSNYSLKFPASDKLFKKDTVIYADVSDIISSFPVDTGTTFDNINNEEIPETEVLAAVLSNPDSIARITHQIEFSDRFPNPLPLFFQKIDNLKTSQKLLRVLHYGDSQIEADRITSYIRFRLQQQFGGSGCGLFPVVPLYGGVPSLSQSYADNWKRYTGFTTRDNTAGHKRFGALFSFSRYQGDSPAGKKSEAWLSFKPSSIGYPSSKIFRQISIFAAVSGDSMELAVKVNDTIIHKELLPPNEKLKRLRWELGNTPKNIDMRVSGKGILEVFSLSADGSWGIAVDNIPMRGSSGLEFSKNDTVFLKEMYRMMNIGMLILQFGGNIVPEMSEDYAYYERFFKRELSLIKRLLPDVPVIVIGPADMSTKINGKFVTYQSLPKVRDAIQNAAFEHGYAFWDMYEAMGGENSMPGWVNADPPLASPDFVHFNHRGARQIAEMFYNALIYEYHRWQMLTQSK